MPTFIPRRRAWRAAATVATSAALAITVVVAAPTAAAPQRTVQRPLAIRFTVVLGEGWFVAKTTAVDSLVNIIWKDSLGQLKVKQSIMSDERGLLITTRDPYERAVSGDTITASVGHRTRTLRIPALTISGHRVSNVISGLAPTSGTVTVGTSTSGVRDHAYYTPLAIGGSGIYSLDLTGHADLKGFDYLDIDWKSPHGDRIYGGRIVPGVTVSVGRSGERTSVRGSADAGRRVTVDLLHGAVTEATIVMTGDHSGSVEGDFVNDAGEIVVASVGDVIRTTGLGSDGDWTIPDIAVHASAATNIATGTCRPRGVWRVHVESPPQQISTGLLEGRADSEGHFSVDLSSEIDLQTDDHVDVYCRMPSGDVVTRRVTVP